LGRELHLTLAPWGEHPSFTLAPWGEGRVRGGAGRVRAKLVLGSSRLSIDTLIKDIY